MSIEVTVLGSGDAFGSPMPGCKVKACAANTQLNKRTRFSLLIKSRNSSLLIGASPDLRQQFLREKIPLNSIDYIFLSHSHYDQIGGLSEFDAVGYRPPIKLLCNEQTMAETKGYFNYLFEKRRLEVNLLELNKPKKFNEFSVTSFELNHYRCFCIGFRIEIADKSIVIAVDTNADLKHASLELMKKADLLFLDGMAETTEEIMLAKRDLSGKSVEKFKTTVDPNKRGHMLIPEAINLSKELAAKKTVLVHLSHYNASHEEMQNKYETKNLLLGFDEMNILL